MLTYGMGQGHLVEMLGRAVALHGSSILVAGESLDSGSIKALLRLYQGSIKALLRLH
jgi:hypothetical protein